jgi:histidine triad (HIT) family protein
MNPDCVFCQIIKGEVPNRGIIMDNEDVIALIPLNPVAKGHTLLIPKKHCENILDCDDQVLEILGKEVKILAKKLIEENNATGFNLLNANGKDAQQSVFHLHLHLVPRYPNDGLDLWIKQGL